MGLTSCRIVSLRKCGITYSCQHSLSEETKVGKYSGGNETRMQKVAHTSLSKTGPGLVMAGYSAWVGEWSSKTTYNLLSSSRGKKPSV